ncbi:Checkpoint protein [Citrus sinensis]|uniref:Checkpoint protein n=1 Tax=Citrus sinensis TaxID=2711 RepID=A0ACB8JBB7_CITSI|nr:Checkpoint protein [Citrus sinensis]
MKFKAFLTENGVNLLEKRFLPALDKMGKVRHLFLTREKAYFLHNLLSGEGIQCVAQFHKETLFDDYRISSQNEDCIAFAIDISSSACSGSAANCFQIKLVKKLPPNYTRAMPFLTFETKGYKSAVIQDVPISKPLSRAQVLELQTALDMAQDLPPTLVQHVGDLLNVSICKYGDLHLQISTTLIILGAEFRKLLVIGEKATRSERAISRGDAQSVQVSVKQFSKSLQCHLAKPDCAFYGIAPQVACLTVIFQFFIPGNTPVRRTLLPNICSSRLVSSKYFPQTPGTRQTDKSILGQAEIALTAASSLFIRQFPNSMAFRNVFYACTLCWVQLN